MTIDEVIKRTLFLVEDGKSKQELTQIITTMKQLNLFGQVRATGLRKDLRFRLFVFLRRGERRIQKETEISERARVRVAFFF